MTKDIQNITRSQLGRLEARFISKVGSRSTFSSDDARKILGHSEGDPTRQFLERLQKKGWIKRIRRGRFAVIPLSSGEERTPQLHEFLVAMELVSPAAIAYWSALNHHGMTEQLPGTVFVATDHSVRRPPTEALGIPFKVVSLRPHKFFGVVRAWLNQKPFMVTDREKTLIDGLDLPQYIGGVGEVAKALAGAWRGLDEARLRDYAARMRNSAVAKRLGYLMETLRLGDPEGLRKAVYLAPGFSPLDPTLPRKGKYNRRWGLLLNLEIDTRKIFKRRHRSAGHYLARQTRHSETDEILRRLQAHRRAIRAYGVRSLGLFGSHARREQKQRSDLDFLVEFERKSFDAYMDLKNYLEDLFDRRVDLVIRDTIKPRLRETILQEAVHAPDYRVYLEDMLEAAARIQTYTAGLSKNQFKADAKTLDAVIRNLEVIGEAAKKVPNSVRKKAPGVDWKRIAGLRDILIHEDFGVEPEIVWDIVQNKLGTLEGQIKTLLANS